MKLLKQPWFLIALFLMGVYSYYISDSGSLSLGSNTAHAGEDSPSQKKEVKDVDLTLDFEAKKLRSFEVSTYQNIDIKMMPTEGDKINIKLVGKGRRYKADGLELKDWLDIRNKRGTLTVNSFSKDGINAKLNDLFKDNSNESLKLIVSFPKAHSFNKINIQSVASDVDARGVNFKEASLESVSGDAALTDGTGDKLSVSTVSGDIAADNISIKGGAFKSVSGDATIKSLIEKPNFSFESVSGDLKLSLPATADIDVNFESMTGELQNEFGAAKQGAGKLSVSSLSGDAKVSKIK